MAVDIKHALIDTNVLLRLYRPEDENYTHIHAALRKLRNTSCTFYYCPQTVAEFWNVATRPLSANGMGISREQTFQRIEFIRNSMQLLEETEAVLTKWLQLVNELGVVGVRVHDIRLAALVRHHNVSHILTLNTRHFQNISGVFLLNPRDYV